MRLHTRIAPTPSGYLHTGNALNFVLTWLWVHKEGGALRLRIDDIDETRVRPGYIDDVFSTLEWLGLDWDEGPRTHDEHEQKFSQSLRGPRYEAIIEELIAGGHVFACNCSRKKLLESGEVCNCREKNIGLNEADVALRIYTPPNTNIAIKDFYGGVMEVNLYEQMRDFVIRRRDGIAAYQIASLTDDIDFSINLIVRGEDLLASTAAQLYLSSLCKPNKFSQAIFYHHPLLTDEHGNKLSKSAGSASIKNMRERGKQPAEVYRLLSKLLGWKEQPVTAVEMLRYAKDGALLKMEQP